MAFRSGLRSGWSTAVTSYNARDHIAELEYDFTTYETRLARYWHNRRYADNSIYHAVNSYADTYKYNESLYKGIRGLRNPIGRLVQIEAAKVFGGAIDYDNFEAGAIVIDGADDTLKESITTILKWSNFDLLKTLFVREGGTMGDIALKVVDDVDREKVRLEILDPRKVYDVQFDEVGNVKYIDIRYERWDAELEKWYMYREVIDKEQFATYRDDAPFAYMQDGAGNEVDRWTNPYGFVPVQWTEHVSTGLGFGVTSFNHVRHKIDNLNDVATLIHDNVRKVVNAKYGVTGAKPTPASDGSPTTITVTDDNRDKAPMLYLGDNGKITPIVSPIDIEGALHAAMDQQREIESDLPQLALQRMRESNSSLSGVAIENMYSDAIDIIGELQGNYSGSLVQALQMAVSVAAFRRYAGFTGYNLNSYDNGAIDFEIKPRVLFRDALSTLERLQMTEVALNSKAPELFLKQLDYSDDDIEMVNNTLADKERRDMRNQRLMARNQPQTKPNDEPQAPPTQEPAVVEDEVA